MHDHICAVFIGICVVFMVPYLFRYFLMNLFASFLRLHQSLSEEVLKLTERFLQKVDIAALYILRLLNFRNHS